jgi:hypothetical protein
MNANPWKIESLRLTSFIDNDLDPKNLEKWLVKISGKDPAQVTKNPQQFIGLSKLDSSILRLEWHHSRIDLIQSPDTPAVENNIGDYSIFQEYCKRYILKYFKMEDCPISNRLALGLALHFPVSDNRDGMQKLKPFLKLVSDIDDVEDFQFRINRPRKYEAIGGVKVNRLLTWTVGQLQLLQIVKSNIGAAKAVPLPQDPQILCRLEMDISTEQNSSTKMSVEQQIKVIKTLINIAKKVAESGEYGL